MKWYENPYILIAIILIALLFIIITGIQIWYEVTFPCIHIPYSWHQPDIVICMQNPHPVPYRDLLIVY